jgi:methylated-DNA-[protein]-cysteine S-methyltransferase
VEVTTMTTRVWLSHVDLPFGRLGLASTDRGLATVLLPTQALPPVYDPLPDDGRNAHAAAQLAEYARGERTVFDLTLDLRGTPFQQAVWREVAAVPHGRTATYRDVARRVGQPNAVRAVGAANGANPRPIVVPCHRIVGADGRLHGYAGGLEMKQALLELEGAVPRRGEPWQLWADRLDGHLIGPRTTGIYCRPRCRYTARLTRIPAIFEGPADALAAGYRPCRVCQP